MKLRPPALSALAALLCSCAATSIQETWRSPDLHAPVDKIAVLAVDSRGLVRRGFENRFVKELSQNGATAVTTFDLLALDEIKERKQVAAERFRASGAQALLIVRLADKSISYHELRPGQEHWAEVVTGFAGAGWYGYYEVGFMSMDPSWGTLKEKVYLEAKLFDLSSQKPLWSGLSKTVVRENMDKVAEMDPLVAKFVAAMRKDGAVR